MEALVCGQENTHSLARMTSPWAPEGVNEVTAKNRLLALPFQLGADGKLPSQPVAP